MAQSKKLLVPFDRSKPEWNPSGFLVPWKHEGKLCFRGLQSERFYELGKMVYIGVAITENDLFAKLVDAGAVIDNVDATLDILRSYLDGLQAFKIGNVVRIRSTDGPETELELVANTPSGVKA